MANLREDKPKRLLGFGLRCFAALAMIVFAIGTSERSRADSPDPIVLSGSVTVYATVVGIDAADRIVTLAGPRSNIVDVYAGEEVRNFDQIAIGDRLKVTYFESVALYVGAPGTQPAVNLAEVMVRAPEGEKPAGMAMGTFDVSATVLGIDTKARELTLQMPTGQVVTNKVDPSVKGFEKLVVGDSVHARLTRAVAIQVKHE